MKFGKFQMFSRWSIQYDPNNMLDIYVAILASEVDQVVKALSLVQWQETHQSLTISRTSKQQ